jgi:hypothetical protein
MAATISQGVEKVMTMAGQVASDKKEADLQRDTVNIQKKGHYSTTDFGTKVTSQDDWLRIVSDDRTGKKYRHAIQFLAKAYLPSQDLLC